MPFNNVGNKHDQLFRVPMSWKIIENPGKINFPGKSWNIDKNLNVMEKSILES